MDGFEYCGNHSKCTNNDDDTRGLTCECDSGYTEHRINFGMGNITNIISHAVCVLETSEDVLCSGCRDLDECTEGEKKCGKNTDCFNTDGGHHCVCQIGFGGDPCKFFGRIATNHPIFSGSFLLPQTANVKISTSVNTSMVLLLTSLTRTPRSGTFLETNGS